MISLNNKTVMNSDRGEGEWYSSHGSSTLNPWMKIPKPPQLWLTDNSDKSSDDSEEKTREDVVVDRSRVRSRIRHHKHRTGNVPIGIFWDIENCQVPRGCSAIDVVAAIRQKFLLGRREADFVVVCDVRKESVIRLQELNDAQVSLIHVCGTQKNAADEKLRQCMRRFGELHTAPAALLLISGDINFAADLSDFRHRKGMEVILVHKQNTSSALKACASSHYCYNELTANLPRNSKVSQTEDDEPSCEMEVTNLPTDQPPERVSRRLRRLADNCGGRVLKINCHVGLLKFPTPDHAVRALKRMDGEDVFGYKIGTRFARAPQGITHAYSSDEGYGTATQLQAVTREQPQVGAPSYDRVQVSPPNEWSLALQNLPPPPTCQPLAYFNPPPVVKLRKIRGTHGSVKSEQSSSSVNSGDEIANKRDTSLGRTLSPSNSSASFSEQNSECEGEPTELTVSNLPAYDPQTLQEMLNELFSQLVPVLKVNVRSSSDGPVGVISLRSEWDARLAIAGVHKVRLDNRWAGRRLELTLGKPSPTLNLDALRARLKAILSEQPHRALPLLRLRDAYASRYCCTLTTSDLAKVRDTVVIHEGVGRVVQLVDLSPPTPPLLDEAPWKCAAHADSNMSQEDGSRILVPVYIDIPVLTDHVHVLLKTHGGILPLLSFIECYEATFPPLTVDVFNGVALELLLRSIPSIVVKDMPSRHIAFKEDRSQTNSPLSFHSDGNSVKSRGHRTAPALEPLLSLFERELTDLLKSAPRCTIPFSKLIPAFHHRYGRQCRVAQYGFTKLPDLLAALENAVVILSSGSSRAITLSPSRQSYRFTEDLKTLLKTQGGRPIHIQELSHLYQNVFGSSFTPVNYGFCTINDLIQRLITEEIVYSQDGTISFKKPTITLEAKAKANQFALQAIQLLCYTPNLRMEFSRFVPAYHAHFNRQLRVSDYGCTKLAELFEMIPEHVSVVMGNCNEREVRMAIKTARTVMSQRLQLLSNVPLSNIASVYASHFGASPLPSMLNVCSLEGLVISGGGAVVDGVVKAPGECPMAVSMCLCAVAALLGDRSVRGSTDDYFVSSFRDIFGEDPDMQHLIYAGVITRLNRRVQLSPTWRTIWRIAHILADSKLPLGAIEISVEFCKRFEPSFPSQDLGFDNIAEFIRYYREVFNENEFNQFSLCADVKVAAVKEQREVVEDFSIYDTPPGHKGSRVFESPKKMLWSSPPASSLPVPFLLLSQEKRRTRLAAQFNAA